MYLGRFTSHISTVVRKRTQASLPMAATRVVKIAAAARTPIGSIGGSLAPMTAPQLGSIAIKACLERVASSTGASTGSSSSSSSSSVGVNALYFGNVLSAGIGQAPARQSAMMAGLPPSVTCTTINKVCASGMKAVQIAAQDIMLGHARVAIAGGTESMSNVPYYLPKARSGARYGNFECQDGIIKDGLWDVYNDFHMGMCAEHCATENAISRKEQDDFATLSYNRAAEAYKRGDFKDEIVSVTIKGRKGDVVVDRDEEFSRFDASKVASLKPAFKKDGTVTAVNASSLNDGAAAVLLMDEQYCSDAGIKPLATVLGFGDFEHEPINFTTAPAYAIPIALERAGVRKEDIARWEINEAFSVVSLINNRLLNLDPAKVNPSGGAVSLGHPIGASGARIIVTLIHGLKPGEIGCAAICNGGGGASAIVIRRDAHSAL